MSAITSSAPSFRLNIGEAARFFARDPQWRGKIALGVVFSLLGFTIIGGLLVQGYLLTLAERVARLEARPLPAWTNYRLLLRKGWRVFLVTLVYSLPLIIIMLGVAGCALWIFSQLGGLQLLRNPDSLSSLHPNTGQLVLAIVLAVALLLLAFPVGLIISFIQPAAFAQLVLHEQVRAAWQFPTVIAFIRRNLGQYALAMLLYLGLTYFLLSFSVSYQASFDHFRSGAFLSDPLFWIIGALIVGLTIVRVIGTFFAQLGLFHILGQFCWYERTATEGQ